MKKQKLRGVTLDQLQGAKPMKNGNVVLKIGEQDIEVEEVLIYGMIVSGSGGL